VAAASPQLPKLANRVFRARQHIRLRSAFDHDLFGVELLEDVQRSPSLDGLFGQFARLACEGDNGNLAFRQDLACRFDAVQPGRTAFNPTGPPA
jgi:hypothetical protein